MPQCVNCGGDYGVFVADLQDRLVRANCDMIMGRLKVVYCHWRMPGFSGTPSILARREGPGNWACGVWAVFADQYGNECRVWKVLDNTMFS
jgi:hypothetical protein